MRARQAAARDALLRGDLYEACRVLGALHPSDFYADDMAENHLSVLRDPAADRDALAAAARAVVRLVPAGTTMA